MSKRKKVLILGDVRGAYRIQNIVKYLVDRPKQYAININTTWCKFRPIKYIKSIFFDPFTVLFSNVVYVNILNVDIDIIYQLFWAKIFRKKVIVDFYISIYEKVVLDEHWFKEKGLLAKLAKGLDKYYYNCGTKVVFLSELEASHYCEMMNVSDKKANKKNVIIPHCIEGFPKVDLEKIYSNKTFNICWWGSYLPLHGIDRLLEAAKILKEKNISVKWYFFGNNDEKAKPYVKKAEELNIMDICVFENSFTMKNGKLLDFLHDKCSLALGNFGDSLKARMLMSNKVLDACSMGALVLTGDAKAYNCFFDGERDIFMSDIEPCNIADVIEKIYYMDSEKLKERAEITYNKYIEFFTPEKYYNQLDMLFESLYTK